MASRSGSDEHIASRIFTQSEASDGAYPMTSSSESFATSPLVTIYVGPRPQIYRIHKDVLTAKSPYFEKCLKAPFAEARTLEVKLEEEHILAFDRFVTWIYGDKVDVINNFESEYQSATEAWVLGDKWCMTVFQNHILKALQARYESKLCTTSELRMLCQLGYEKSKLGEFFFDLVVYQLVKHHQVEFSSDLPTHREDLEILAAECPKVMVRILEAASKGDVDKDPSFESGCKYHVHPAGSPSCDV